MGIILGVGAGIAAYKSCELLRLLTESGHDVRVVPTPDALRFVGAATWAALSGQPVATTAWDDVHQVPHVRLGQGASLVLVAPATADLLARAAAGMSGDLLTSVLLTARCPVIFAPAMHTEMWEHPATQASVATLRGRGALVLEPATGRLTGKDSGPGRLPEPAELLRVAVRVLARGAAGLAQDLAGRQVVVSAGGTREELDPVRFLGNWSSGRQGYALAIMAAAVADYRPESRSDVKIKKSLGAPPPVRLAENPDILRELSADRLHPGQVIVGFGAETGDLVANGRAKLAAKGCDLLVVNKVGPGIGFGVPDNAAVVLAADGTQTHVPHGPKEALADVIWDLVAAALAG